MGNQQSSVLATSQKAEQSFERISDKKGQNITEKTILETQKFNGVLSEDTLDLFDTETDSETDDNDDEDDEELLERLRILEDAKNLKRLAVAFLHPERPVEVEFDAYARCYFDRPSAPEQETFEEAEERNAILQDAQALKKLATDYAHPELKVKSTDYLSCARCYFDRASAPEQETREEADERALILQDVENLRRAAREYLHPELGVVTSDPTACARCYFDRASAPEQETVEYAEERRMALADAAALKKLAVDYLHPELGVVTSDPTACARCYFDRASAPEQQSCGAEPKSSSNKNIVPIIPKATNTDVSTSKDVSSKRLPSHTDVNVIRKSASAVQLYGLDEDHGNSESFF